jgi:hypothetical protein
MIFKHLAFILSLKQLTIFKIRNWNPKYGNLFFHKGLQVDILKHALRIIDELKNDLTFLQGED